MSTLSNRLKADLFCPRALKRSAMITVDIKTHNKSRGGCKPNLPKRKVYREKSIPPSQEEKGCRSDGGTNRGKERLDRLGDPRGTSNRALIRPMPEKKADCLEAKDYLYQLWKQRRYTTRGAQDYDDWLRRAEKEARRRVPYQPPPPHQITDEEMEYYRGITSDILRDYAPRLPDDLLGIIKAYLGDPPRDQGYETLNKDYREFAVNAYLPAHLPKEMINIVMGYL
jgi:hypothetical protein